MKKLAKAQKEQRRTLDVRNILLERATVMKQVVGAVVLSGMLVGCASIDYRPNEGAVALHGLPEAWQQFRTVMLRAVTPQMQDVQLTADGIAYRGTRLLPMFVRAPVEGLMAFVNIRGVDVYANHTVYVKGAAGQATDIFVLASAQDAKAFADLLMSFRSEYLRDKASFQSLPAAR